MTTTAHCQVGELGPDPCEHEAAFLIAGVRVCQAHFSRMRLQAHGKLEELMGAAQELRDATSPEVPLRPR